MARIDLDSEGASGRKSGSSNLFRKFLYALVAGAVAAGAGYWFGRQNPRSAPPPPPAAAAPVAPPAQGAPAQAAPAQAAPPEAAFATAVAAPSAATAGSTTQAAAAPTPPPAKASPEEAGPRRLSVTVSGPLEESISAAFAAGQKNVAAELAQVANRLLVWRLNVSKDARKGDKLEILWSPAPPGGSGPTHSQEPVIEALRYDSQKLGKTLTAYRHQPKGAKYARSYDANGAEVEERLVDGPIRDYEQITSLVKDGRRHKGVDFRTPVGTPVYAPFDGVIERRNWNFAGNGNCLDLADGATGRHAIFLHLDVVPKAMAVGRAVKKGEQIAESGNSGHSTAPHLHYQLEDAAGKVLDPFKVHATTRAALPAADKAAFDAERARLDARLAN